MPVTHHYVTLTPTASRTRFRAVLKPVLKKTIRDQHVTMDQLRNSLNITRTTTKPETAACPKVTLQISKGARLSQQQQKVPGEAKTRQSGRFPVLCLTILEVNMIGVRISKRKERVPDHKKKTLAPRTTERARVRPNATKLAQDDR